MSNRIIFNIGIVGKAMFFVNKILAMAKNKPTMRKNCVPAMVHGAHMKKPKTHIVKTLSRCDIIFVFIGGFMVLLLYCRQGDYKCRSLERSALQKEKSSMMIILDNAFCKRQSYAPATLFGSKTGLINLFPHRR